GKSLCGPGRSTRKRPLPQEPLSLIPNTGGSKIILRLMRVYRLLYLVGLSHHNNQALSGSIDCSDFSCGWPMHAGRPFSTNSLWVIPQRTQALESKSKRCPRAVRSSGILASSDSDVSLDQRTVRLGAISCKPV